MDRRGYFRVSDLPGLFGLFVILLLIGASFPSGFWSLIFQEVLWRTINFVGSFRVY